MLWSNTTRVGSPDGGSPIALLSLVLVEEPIDVGLGVDPELPCLALAELEDLLPATPPLDVLAESLAEQLTAAALLGLGNPIDLLGEFGWE